MRVLGKAVMVGALLALTACGDKARNVLIPIDKPAPNTSRVDILVATTRLPSQEPGEMFTGERNGHTSYAEIGVSIPPASIRKVGEVQWPASDTPDPEREFAALYARKIRGPEAAELFRAALRKQGQGRVLVFVHGYNTHFTDAVFGYAQFIQDSGAPAVPILFTWPSRGDLLAYGYDRESTAFSRDSLEKTLDTIASHPEVKDITVLAHSMGTWLTMETLRQMGIRKGRLPPKIHQIILAAPDIDIDVFKKQVPALGEPRPGLNVLVSRDDKALAASRRLSQSQARLGAIDPEAEPLKSELAALKVRVADLTDFKSNDSYAHSKFAASPMIVKAIGQHLARGNDFATGPGSSLITRAGSALTGATGAIINAPLAIVDRGAQAELRRALETASGSVGE